MLLGLLIFYALAKIAEILDHQIFEFTLELISGHSAKHVPNFAITHRSGSYLARV